MPTGADADAGDPDAPGEVRVDSPDRPIPLTAQMALEEYGLVRTERPGGDGPVEVAYLRRRPPAAFLAEHGLRVPAGRRELWRGPGGRLVEVRPDRVVVDGATTDIDPGEAREHVRSGGFEPVDVPDDVPDGG